MKYKVKNTVTGEETICEKVVLDNHDYYLSENPKLDDYCYNPRTKEFFKVLDTMMIDGLNKNNDDYTVIATTNKSLDLPMVIDEVEELAELSSEVQEATFNSQHKLTYKFGYIDGYQRAKEAYSYTKDDMVKFVEWLNLQYRDLEHTKALKETGSVSELIDIWQEQRTIEILVK